MKKMLISLFLSVAIIASAFAHGHFKRPEFIEGTEKAYMTYEDEKYLPLKVVIGKTKDSARDVVYVWGWGRIFVDKTDEGWVDRNNNFDVFIHKNGDITIKANVTMMDLYYNKPKKKGTFYHSTYGYLHSHVYPKLDKNLVGIEGVDYEVVRSEVYSPYDPSVMYKEKHGKFTYLYIGDAFNDKESGWPEMAEFKFEAKLHPVPLETVTMSDTKEKE